MHVDFVARHPHFIDHLAPLYRALPVALQGRFYTRKLLRDRVRHRGITPYHPKKSTSLIREIRQRGSLVVVTGFADLQWTSKTGRPHVWVEHGAGFTFSDSHPSFVGSSHMRERVRLFLCPSETTAALQRQACPWGAAEAIGCPKLDARHRSRAEHWRTPRYPKVAISFHFDSQKCPETRSAFPHYRRILLELSRRYDLIGHSHPHMADQLRPIYHRLGVEFIEDFDDVMELADLYICDASSTLYEFASLGRPVVVLNAPWYRRDVHHEGNLRFWSHADVGVQVDHPEQLIEAVALALQDSPEQKRARERAVQACYYAVDGRASERGAAAIVALVAQLAAESGRSAAVRYGEN